MLRLPGIDRLKNAMASILLVIAFFYSAALYSQRRFDDTSKFNLKFVPGVKFTPDGFVAGPQFHSNLGLELRQDGKPFEYFIRNYFNTEIFVGDTTQPYSYIPANFYYMRNTFVSGTNYYFKHTNLKLSTV